MMYNATVSAQLMGMKNTIEQTLQFNYDNRIIKSREFKRNMQKLVKTAIPKLCDKYGMEAAVSKLEEIREDLMGGCSFDNSYIKAINPEKVSAIFESLEQYRQTIVLGLKYNEDKATISYKKDLSIGNWENIVRSIENA